MEVEGVTVTVMGGFRMMFVEVAANGVTWLVAVISTVCCGVIVDGAV
jgi:hypothetical protein